MPVAAVASAAPAYAASQIVQCTNPTLARVNASSCRLLCRNYYSSSISSNRQTATATAYAFPRGGPTASGAYFSVGISTQTYGSARLSARDTTSSVEHLTNRHNGSSYSGIYNPIPLTNETTGCNPTYAWPGPSTNMDTRYYQDSLRSLQDRARNHGNRQTTRYVFSQPVWDLTVTIGDIDNLYGVRNSSLDPSFCNTRYRDYVAVHTRYQNSTTPVSGGVVGTRNQVVGSGTTADPFRRADNYLPADDDTWAMTRGTVQTTFADGPITEVSVDYWIGEGSGLQVILTSFDFGFCPPRS